MKIVHFCISCFYIDNYSYQENQLVAQNVRQGHDVTVVASTETFGKNNKLTYVSPGDYMGSDGARVIRLPYKRILNHKISTKFRAHPGIENILKEIEPDVIMFHGLCGWELLTVARYVKNHPDVLLYSDCHEDFFNSARTFVSKWVLHYLFYRPILRYSLPQIRKILCISKDAMVFAREMYGVDESLLEFFPLGGDIFSDIDYHATRTKNRLINGWGDEMIVFVQSGKMDEDKKLTDSLAAFRALPGAHLRFIIAGSLSDSIATEVMSYINSDSRIAFLGWQTADGLKQLLCASDVYLQPGSQSATMQMSLCCRCVIVLNDVLSHKVFVKGNGFLIGESCTLESALERISVLSRANLNKMKNVSAIMAAELLDYEKLAARLFR